MGLLRNFGSKEKRGINSKIRTKEKRFVVNRAWVNAQNPRGNNEASLRPGS